jgi:acyl-CoA reductase-like NAD-dependent aldehyde dehydrogenase
VVFNDADPVAAANGAAFASFVASGQTCVSGTRIIVQSEIYDEFMTHFLHKVESITIRMGDRAYHLAVLFCFADIEYAIALNPDSTMGSVISPKQLERIESVVRREGKGTGKIIAGGKRLTGKSRLDDFDFSDGAFFPPTVITNVSTEDDLWREEIFGPVVVVKKFAVSNIHLSMNLLLSIH